MHNHQDVSAIDLPDDESTCIGRAWDRYHCNEVFSRHTGKAGEAGAERKL